ncbi:uncharacterized protein LOC132634060 [Lycium barbarum]|uniref:uncharacterized protein LOC132634060 n=1 Tax=Lycium barbarum TaxID=112863 RepID=UPI00293E4C41|nr:uncharacterized protein LOC132634060 [Lycium barbarum]
MYICFQALKMGYKDGLRPFIGLDGTFLKGKEKGQLLVALGQDSQNHFYPLAWAVVDKETNKSWTWFIEHLEGSLELNIGEGVTFISDMQKGLINAIKNVLPQAKRRCCAKHVEANWAKNGRSLKMKKLFWWASWSNYPEEFKDQLMCMGKSSEAAVKSLLKYPSQSWCRAYFDIICKNPSVTNNH